MSPALAVIPTHALMVFLAWRHLSFQDTAVGLVLKEWLAMAATVKTLMKWVCCYNKKQILEYINAKHVYASVFFLHLFQCSLAQPCYSPSACVNTVKGFRCEPCPPGYWGKPVLGFGLDYAKNHKQVLTRTHKHIFIGCTWMQLKKKTGNCFVILVSSFVITHFPHPK